jgi:hypothetical protein
VGGKGGGGGRGGEMTQALYAHMNNKKKKDKRISFVPGLMAFFKKKKCGTRA